jgi:L-arabinose transport system substrate-binding protein
MSWTTPRRRVRWSGAALGAVALCLGAAACGSDDSSDSSGGGSAAKERTKLGLITQLSVAPYFVQEADGAKAEAKRLGVDLDVVDSARENTQVISLTQTMITSGVKGLAIVPGNTDIGPRVASATKRADVALIASDSPLKAADGTPVPFVGLNNEQSGVQVGEILARIYKEEGWSAADTYYANVEVPLQACLLRTNAAVDTFRKANADFAADHVVKVPYDGAATKANDSMRATITAHSNAKHWVITSCNDDGVVGALRALQNKKFPVGDVIGVGLGGNLACSAFKTPYVSEGMRATTWNDPAAIGATVVKRLHETVVEKKQVPAETFVRTPEVNAKNYADEIDCSKQK